MHKGLHSLEKVHLWLNILLMPGALRDTFIENKVEQPLTTEVRITKRG